MLEYWWLKVTFIAMVWWIRWLYLPISPKIFSLEYFRVGERSVQGGLLVIFHSLSLSFLGHSHQRVYVLLLILTLPSFLWWSLGTFALLKLPTLWWGTLIIKMKSYLLEVYIRFLPNYVYICYTRVEIFKVHCLFTGQYYTKEYITFIDVI